MKFWRGSGWLPFQSIIPWESFTAACNGKESVTSSVLCLSGLGFRSRQAISSTWGHQLLLQVDHAESVWPKHHWHLMLQLSNPQICCPELAVATSQGSHGWVAHPDALSLHISHCWLIKGIKDTTFIKASRSFGRWELWSPTDLLAMHNFKEAILWCSPSFLGHQNTTTSKWRPPPKHWTWDVQRDVFSMKTSAVIHD